MKAVAAALLIIFAGMALFSFTGMVPGGHHFEFGGCSASLLRQTVCPDGNSVLAAAFHTGAYQAFSTAVVSSISALLLVVLAALFALLSHSFPPIVRFSLLRIARENLSSRRDSLEPVRRWFTRLERTPSR
jgi:hypothetical protein